MKLICISCSLKTTRPFLPLFGGVNLSGELLGRKALLKKEYAVPICHNFIDNLVEIRVVLILLISSNVLLIRVLKERFSLANK